MDDTSFYMALRGARGADPEARLRFLVKKSSLQRIPLPKKAANTHAMNNDVQKQMADVVARMKALAAKTKVKKASLEEVKQQAVAAAKKYAPELIGGGIGAAAGGTYGYFASRRREPGKPSALEVAARESLRNYERAGMDLRKDKKKPGLSHKMRGVYARAFADAARVMRDHPVAAGALYGGAAGSAGAGLGRAAYETFKEETSRSLDV